MVLLALDPEGTVTLINRKGCAVLGYAEEEIVGKNWFANFLPADIVQQVNGVFIRMRAGDIDLVEHYENPVLCKNGQVRLIAWHNMAQRDEAGRIVQFLASGEDITERRNAELRLRASEERYRGVVDHIAIGVAMISPQMEILTLKPADGRVVSGPGARDPVPLLPQALTIPLGTGSVIIVQPS